MELADKELFLRYALPCGRVLVKRGTITQEQLDQGLSIDPALFKVGLFMCAQAAKALGKDSIDRGAIRQYFWLDHDSALVEHAKTHPDIDINLCTVWPAEYLGNSLVRIPPGERKVNISYTPNLKKGDYATVHYDRTCEVITAEEFHRLWELKK
ncbi:MAG: hypothetical protein KAW41_06850 [Candidatus Diapherotrites archaeon]|nr:hypothetical protein [Candidatus Diapherotrites archaeon]